MVENGVLLGSWQPGCWKPSAANRSWVAPTCSSHDSQRFPNRAAIDWARGPDGPTVSVWNSSVPQATSSMEAHK
jgi:hypothetical protein